MALPVVHVPAGAILRYPDGTTRELKAGQHVDAPAGTTVPIGPVGVAPTTLAVESEVIAQPTAGQEAPGLSSTGAPAPAPQGTQPASSTAQTKPWDQTKQGVSMSHGYDTLRAMFSTTLPSVRKQLENLANRPIGG